MQELEDQVLSFAALPDICDALVVRCDKLEAGCAKSPGPVIKGDNVGELYDKFVQRKDLDMLMGSISDSLLQKVMDSMSFNLTKFDSNTMDKWTNQERGGQVHLHPTGSSVYGW